MSPSLRLQLALWYSALTGAVVVLVCGYSYVVHSRTHYDDLDELLRKVGDHVTEELAQATTEQERLAVLTASRRLGADVRLHEDDGRLRGPLAPPPAVGVDPRALLAAGPRHAYPAIAALAPALHPIEVEPGRLGVLAQPATGRWRVLVLPRPADGAYLVAAHPLAHLDASVRYFGQLMLAMALLGCALTLVAGWIVAGRALRPVTVLTDTARAIAQSRRFSQRVPAGVPHDELGRLAATFNAMLASLEAAYAAQQRFVSDASHELRAPLTVIQANLELLQRHRAMPPVDREQAVHEAHDEAGRLARLVADLLVLARADAGLPIRRQRVELDRVLMDVLGEARHLAREHHLEVGALEPVMLDGDPDRLKQLLLVLIDNALKYTPPGRRISVALRRAVDTAELTVRDHGIGIAAADLPRVFERFYRADPARSRDPGGTGLGLPIGRWIAAQHGGSIEMESTPGLGTTATVRLPLAD